MEHVRDYSMVGACNDSVSSLVQDTVCIIHLSLSPPQFPKKIEKGKDVLVCFVSKILGLLRKSYRKSYQVTSYQLLVYITEHPPALPPPPERRSYYRLVIAKYRAYLKYSSVPLQPK